jgi:hypothetical protein
MPCHAMHPIQDLFLEGFSYGLQIDMHFICTPMWTKFYSCQKWVLHLTPSRVLHIAAFLTLCDTYMGIESHFDNWNHFFRSPLLQGLSMEAAVLGGVNLYVKSRLRVDPYFHLCASESMNGWWKVWFFLRNDVDTPVPMFTSSRPVPQPNSGYGVARRDLHRPQPLREVVQQLWREGLIAVDLL